VANRTVTDGKKLVLKALSGKSTERVPVVLFTHLWDYVWKVAGLEPWLLACGDHETWHKAYMALVERHRPDGIIYTGIGSGPEKPSLCEQNAKQWLVKDNNTGRCAAVSKDSYARTDAEAGIRDPRTEIETREDADRLIPEFKSYHPKAHLDGLTRLIADVGDRALVFPNCSPAFTAACSTFGAGLSSAGFEKTMITMLEDPGLFKYVCERFKTYEDLRMKELVSAGAECVFISEGWASADIISVPMIEDLALPCQAYTIQAAHNAGLKTVLWNEGNVLPILKQEAALEMDAFWCEQPRKGAGATVADVRKAFGPNRCLFGNLDSETLLMRNQREEIAGKVREQIEQSGRGLPFVLSTGSPLPSNVEPEAVDAVFETAWSTSLQAG